MSRTLQVTDDQLYTVRWAINNQRPDRALGVLAEMLGESGAAIPEPLNALVFPRPEKIKIALVIGHNERLTGANAGGAMGGISEWKWNNQVADYMIRAGSPEFEFRKFLRPFLGLNRYTAEISAAYTPVKAWQPDLAVELHFNGGRGDYTFQLAAVGATTAQAVARIFSRVFAAGIGVRDAGVKISGRGDRGGASLYAVECPMILTEPFFGDNPDHTKRVAELGVAGMAALYFQACSEASKLLI